MKEPSALPTNGKAFLATDFRTPPSGLATFLMPFHTLPKTLPRNCSISASLETAISSIASSTSSASLSGEPSSRLARSAELERLRFERHFTLSPALRARTHRCMHDCLLQMKMLISRPQAVPQISSSSSGATLVRIPFGSNLRRPYLLMTAEFDPTKLRVAGARHRRQLDRVGRGIGVHAVQAPEVGFQPIAEVQCLADIDLTAALVDGVDARAAGSLVGDRGGERDFGPDRPFRVALPFGLLLQLLAGAAASPVAPFVGDRIGAGQFESGPAILEPELVDRPLADVEPDLRTGIVLARCARLAVREDVGEPHDPDQVAHQVAPGLELRGRRTVAAELVALPPPPLGVREVAGELDGDAAGIEAVRRPQELGDRMKLQDAAVGGDREMRVDAQETLERVGRPEAARHLVQHQRIDLLRIALALAVALVRLVGEIDDA